MSTDFIVTSLVVVLAPGTGIIYILSQRVFSLVGGLALLQHADARPELSPT